MHVVILACPESFLVPLRKGGYRGLLKKDSRQAGMTDNVSLLIAILVTGMIVASKFNEGCFKATAWQP